MIITIDPLMNQIWQKMTPTLELFILALFLTSYCIYSNHVDTTTYEAEIIIAYDRLIHWFEIFWF